MYRGNKGKIVARSSDNSMYSLVVANIHSFHSLEGGIDSFCV